MTPASSIIKYIAELKNIDLSEEYLKEIEKKAGMLIALSWPSAVTNSELNIEILSKCLKEDTKGKLYLKSCPVIHTYIDDLIRRAESQESAGLFVWDRDREIKFYTIQNVYSGFLRIRFHNGKMLMLTRKELVDNSLKDSNNPKNLVCWNLISRF
jgi:hypothetical protein